jgi:hypothetical protein
MDECSELPPSSGRKTLVALLLGLIVLVSGALIAAFLPDQRPPGEQVPDRTALAPDTSREPPGSQDAGPEPEAPGPEEEGRSISILVISSNGDVAAGAQVRIGVFLAPAHDRDRPPPIVGTTAADGRWVASIPPDWPRSGLAACATSADGTEGTRRQHLFAIGDSLRLRMAPCATVHGVVTGLDAGEWKETLVRAYASGWPERFGRMLPVRSDGSFTVTAVPHYLSLYALAPGRAPSAFTRLRPSPGVTRGVVLELGPPSIPARVRLVDDTGAHLPIGARVLVRCGPYADRPARVGEEGWLTLPYAVPGNDVRLTVLSARRADGETWTSLAKLDVTYEEWVGEPTLTVVRSGNARIRFKGPDGRGVPGLRLWLVCVGKEKAYSMNALYTDTDGVLSPFDGGAWPPDRYSLRDDLGREVWIGDVAVQDPVPIHEVELPKMCEITVVLTDDEGNEIRTDNVTACPALVADGGDRRTEGMRIAFRESARVAIHLGVEEVSECCIRVRFVGWPRPIDVPIPESHVVTIAPPRDSGTVVVRISPATTGGIQLRRSGLEKRGSLLRGRFDAHGVATLPGVVPGEYTWKTRVSLLPEARSGSLIVGPGRNSLEVKWSER